MEGKEQTSTRVHTTAWMNSFYAPMASLTLTGTIGMNGATTFSATATASQLLIMV
jgi:hypothetical protein